jgi:dipeptidyl aminopeptidase/acylaminoacyl peptidase
MRRLFLLVLAIIAFTLPALTQAKRPFTFEDMMKLKRVGEPVVSPDGKWVVFSVVDVDLDANSKTPHIWIVATAGGQEKVLIADQDGDRPRWSPDGKQFAFISTKDRGSQTWIADFDSQTGTVTSKNQLTIIATEVDSEVWSPDGNYILFVSNVYPECGGTPVDEMECNANKLDEAGNSKVKAQTFTHLLYRHWNAYKEGKRSHLFVVPIRACSSAEGARGDGQCSLLVPAPAARDLTPGDYDAPVFSLGGQDDYAFSPDGKEICYASNHDKNPAASTNNDLWIVPVNFSQDAKAEDVLARTKNITADNPASDTSPLYSPDGRYIAYRAQQRPGYESDRFRLMLYDRKTGAKKNLSEKFDAWVGTFTWSPDSSTIFFVTEEAGESPIYQWNVGALGTKSETQPKTEPVLVTGGFNDDLAVAPDGKHLLFTLMSIGSPTEIYRGNLIPNKEGAWAMSLVDALCTEKPDKNLKNLDEKNCTVYVSYGSAVTHLNDSVLSQVAMAPLESFWFPGANGDKVQGFLVRPPNFDATKKYPLKFIVHGGPEVPMGDLWSYRWNAQLFAAPTSSSPGYVVIMINFHGSPGYGQKFIDAINGDWGGVPFEDLMKGLDYAEKTYPFIDKDRECALGASYGGYMINWILGHTDRFKCLVSHDGMFNAESAWGTTEELWFNNWEFKGTPYDNRAAYQKWSPHQYAKNFKTPTLVIHSQRDYRLDVSEGFQLFTTLQMEGVPSKMLYFPDEGHWILKPQNGRLWYKTVNDWVDQWTKK